MHPVSQAQQTDTSIHLPPLPLKAEKARIIIEIEPFAQTVLYQIQMRCKGKERSSFNEECLPLERLHRSVRSWLAGAAIRIQNGKEKAPESSRRKLGATLTTHASPYAFYKEQAVHAVQCRYPRNIYIGRRLISCIFLQ